MNAPGRTLLKVTSILLIIIGGLATLGSCSLFRYASLSGSGLAALLALLVVALCIAYLVIGIIGVMRCGDPSRASFFIISGTVICILGGISLIVGIAAGTFQITNLLGLVLPILFISGGNMNKRAWEQDTAYQRDESYAPAEPRMPITPISQPTMPQTESFCKTCGYKHPQDSRFCERCGTPL